MTLRLYNLLTRSCYLCISLLDYPDAHYHLQWLEQNKLLANQQVALPLGDSSLAAAVTRHYTISTENVRHINKLSRKTL